MAGESIVLICARDPMIAALLGMFAELTQHTPAFPRPDERPEDALQRVRPLLVVVLDSALDAARSDLFFARAAKRRVGLVLLGDRDGTRALADMAQPRGIPWLELPADFQAFREALQAGAEARWWRAGGDRRREQRGPRAAPRAAHPVDDALVFVDNVGQRWFVYDRRGADRRRAERRRPEAAERNDPASAQDVRLFVREDGERRSYELAEGEATDLSPESLARQLSLSIRV